MVVFFSIIHFEITNWKYVVKRQYFSSFIYRYSKSPTLLAFIIRYSHFLMKTHCHFIFFSFNIIFSLLLILILCNFLGTHKVLRSIRAISKYLLPNQTHNNAFREMCVLYVQRERETLQMHDFHFKAKQNKKNI